MRPPQPSLPAPLPRDRARRTQAAFPAYLSSTRPSDLTVLSGLYGVAGSHGYDPAVIARIAGLPGVRHVTTYLGLNVAILAPGQGPNAAETEGSQALPGSLDGEYFTTDKATIVAGRMADPAREGEVVLDAKGTPPGVGVGATVPVGFYSNAQLSAPPSGHQPKPY